MAPVGDPRPLPWSGGGGDRPRRLRRARRRAGARSPATMTAGGLIDAEPRVGKSSGIYCAPLPPGFPSLIQMTYRDLPRDAYGLAHELGHAVHFELAKAAHSVALGRSQPEHGGDRDPVDHGRDRGGGARHRRLARGRTRARCCAGSSRTASRSCSRRRRCAASSRTRPRLRAGGVALTAERLTELWLARIEPYFGPVASPDGWIQWPHPYGARFYNYQYSFAFLCSFCLAAAAPRADPTAFRAGYVAMLARGRLAAAGRPARACAASTSPIRGCGSAAWTRSSGSARRPGSACGGRRSGSRSWRRIWGGSYLFNEIALRELEPGAIVWARVTLGALMIWPLAIVERRHRRPAHLPAAAGGDGRSSRSPRRSR